MDSVIVFCRCLSEKSITIYTPYFETGCRGVCHRPPAAPPVGVSLSSFFSFACVLLPIMAMIAGWLT